MLNKYAFILLLFISLSGSLCFAQTGQEDAGTMKESLDNVALQESVKVYPNPVQSYLTIYSKMPITKVEIYTLLGQRARRVDSGFSSIYLGDLNSGIYMIKVFSNDLYITKKLVKR